MIRVSVGEFFRFLHLYPGCDFHQFVIIYSLLRKLFEFDFSFHKSRSHHVGSAEFSLSRGVGIIGGSALFYPYIVCADQDGLNIFCRDIMLAAQMQDRVYRTMSASAAGIGFLVHLEQFIPGTQIPAYLCDIERVGTSVRRMPRG